MTPERQGSAPRAATAWSHDLRTPNGAPQGRRTGGRRKSPSLRGALRGAATLVRDVFVAPERGRANPRGWVVASAGAWAMVALYAYIVAPRGALALASGFALLYVALAATLVPVCRVVGVRLMPRALRTQIPFSHAVRQSLLLALLITANFALLAGRAWSPPALVVGLIALGIEEAVTLARK